VVNIGLYGNTAQASRPPTNAWLTVVSYDDGGSATGTCSLYWSVGGAATGHTLAVDVSVDNGQTWSNAARRIIGRESCLQPGHDAVRFHAARPMENPQCDRARRVRYEYAFLLDTKSTLVVFM
jgi:hypothetical protein